MTALARLLRRLLHLDTEPEIPDEPDEIVATIYERAGRSVYRSVKEKA